MVRRRPPAAAHRRHRLRPVRPGQGLGGGAGRAVAGRPARPRPLPQRRRGRAAVDRAGRPAWRVGVENPGRPERLLDVLERERGAVATSGTSRRGAHIVDPHAGRPAEAVRSVTVVGPDLLWADVYATAAVARGADALDWLATLDGYAGLLVDAAGRLRATPNWPGTRPAAQTRAG
ncbi:FAD:protein FMN transferase [Micromonospora sp. ATA51]|uniref:FAD:protein FMN transferase n=1 Tax=Micromonospora sp. ATA51 TaxID=2806098 RepID=UPI0035CBC469